MNQLRALQYLLRQGIAIRGHTEVEGNLYQLLKVWANNNSDITHWLSEGKYMSAIDTEQITLMGNTLLRSLLQIIKQNSPTWYAIMGDEASDIANREQLNISIRWVNESYEISEDPVGLFVSTTLVLMPFVMLSKIFLFAVAFLCHFVEAKRMMEHQICRM